MAGVKFIAVRFGIRVYTGLLLLLLIVPATRSQITVVNSEKNVSVTIAAWMQPRYDFYAVDDGDQISRFSIRRVLLDIRGHAFSEKFTYRVTPELSDLDLSHARNVYPILLYVNYAFSSGAQIMFGQFPVPFHWHFYVPLPGLYFYERSMASNDFGTFGGWDKGIMLHGSARIGGQPFRYGLALIDGEGFNRRKNRDTGHTVSAQAVYALTGILPPGESDLRGSRDPQLTLGLGGQFGWENEARDWSLGMASERRGDFTAGTAFARFAFRGLSIIGEGFYRKVDPKAASLDSYTGNAYTVSAGYMVIPSRFELIGRYTGLDYHTGIDNTNASEWGAGCNIFFSGHNAQLRIQYQRVDRGPLLTGGNYGQFVIEAQIHFF